MQPRYPKWKLLAFTLLSACDFIITYLLLSRSQEMVYEANPVANRWLQANGWVGLAVFKTVLVVAVSLIATYVYYRRPRIAHDLLALSCGAVIVAVVSGTSIAMTVAGTTNGDETHSNIRRSANSFAHAHSIRSRKLEYKAMLDEVAVHLAANRITLSAALAKMNEVDTARNPEWIVLLRQAYPGLEDRALLAADVVQHTVASRLRTPSAQPLAERLENEFRELYGATPILPYRQMLNLVAPVADRPAASVANSQR